MCLLNCLSCGVRRLWGSIVFLFPARGPPPCFFSFFCWVLGTSVQVCLGTLWKLPFFLLCGPVSRFVPRARKSSDRGFRSHRSVCFSFCPQIVSIFLGCYFLPQTLISRFGWWTSVPPRDHQCAVVVFFPPSLGRLVWCPLTWFLRSPREFFLFFFPFVVKAAVCPPVCG